MDIVAISDIHEISRLWKYRIETGRLTMSVSAYVTRRENAPFILDNIPVLRPDQFISLYKRGIFTKYILPRERYDAWSTIVKELLNAGVKGKDILITGRNDRGDINDIIPYTKSPYLPYLEFHIADHCNLKCKACEHYSGLVKVERFHKKEEIRKDLKKLSEYISDIGTIRILGGEPLLNPELPDIIRITRKVYTHSNIVVVTNGLLINTMGEDFFASCRECDAKIWISYYPPIAKLVPEIKQILERSNVNYEFSGLNMTFRMKYRLHPKGNVEDSFRNCFQAMCHNLYKGRVGVCFLPFTQEDFNRNYEKKIPCDGSIDIYDDKLDTEGLKRFLDTPFERCSYCDTNPIEVDWDQMKGDITDWVIL